MDYVKALLRKRYKDDARAEMICEAFANINEEAICVALLKYHGNFPPYPKDIEEGVFRANIDGTFMRAIRKSGRTSRDMQLESQRRWILETLRGGER